jgi:hypothetical protein
MEGSARRQLLLLDGGRKAGAPPGSVLPREALRVIPGGSAGDVQAAIEETVEASRRVRREIEERIARALAELF